MSDVDRIDLALAPLERLSDLLPVGDIVAAVQEFADIAVHFKEVARAAVRVRALETLRARGIGSPSRMVDAAFKEARRLSAGAAADNGTLSQGSGVLFAAVEPWPESVDGADLLDEIVATVRNHLCMRHECAVAVALWTLHSHTTEHAHCSPRLAILSPTKRCGKTTLLRLLTALVARPLASANVSSAVLFRIIEQYGPTLLIDEADAFARENDELRGLINAGHDRTSGVLRCVGDTHEPRLFRVFGAMAIAAIGRLPDTIMDRSVVIEMQRKKEGENVRVLRRPELAELGLLQRKCARWAKDAAPWLEAARPELPADLHDRAADNWEPLLAIGAVAGGTWPKAALDAAHALSKSQDQREVDDLKELLLRDIAGLLDAELKTGGANIRSEILVGHLLALEGRPWSDLRGQPLNAHRLARLLSPFGVTPRTFRDAESTPKGYSRAALHAVRERYLRAESATSETPAESTQRQVRAEPQQPPPVAISSEGRSARENGDVADVLDPDQLSSARPRNGGSAANR